jgi:SOS-response transcriptional repressor LexA
MHVNTLTPRQAEFVAAVDRLTRENGFPPTLQELADAIGVSTCRAAGLATIAVARGHLLHTPRRARSFRVVPADAAG